MTIRNEENDIKNLVNYVRLNAQELDDLVKLSTLFYSQRYPADKLTRMGVS